MGYEHVFFEDLYRFYELVCFSEDNGTNTHLHVGEFITLTSEEGSESFAILRSIFSHRWNNQHFAFIIIDRFEITNQTRLECPVYRLGNTRRICPISEVDTNRIEHFIHYCRNDECSSDNGHNLENDLYIRNMYFFKVV